MTALIEHSKDTPNIIGFPGSKATGHIQFLVEIKLLPKRNHSKKTRRANPKPNISNLGIICSLKIEAEIEIKVKYVKNGVYSVLNSYPCLV